MMSKRCIALLIALSMVFSFFSFQNNSKVHAADPHPWFINMTDINNRIANNTWAQTFKTDLQSKADVWLTRSPIFVTDAENHYTLRQHFICPMDNAAPEYTYAASIPTSFTCPGPDGDLTTTADNHTMTSADVTAAEWASIQKGWETKQQFDQLSGILQLAFAYQLTDGGDPKKAQYGQQAAVYLKDYSAKYINYKKHDNTGAIEPASLKSTAGKSSMQWLDDALFFLQLGSWSYDMLYDSGYLSSSDKTSVEDALRSGIAILPSTSDPGADWSVPYNWGVVNSAAQASVGYLLGDTTMQQKAKDGFNYAMNNSVKSDGFWWEGTFSYHNLVLDNLFILGEAAYRRGASTHENLYGNTTLKKMYDILTKAAYPNRELQRNNDSRAAYIDRDVPTAANVEVANFLYSDSIFDNLLNLSYTGTGALSRSNLVDKSYELYGYKAMFIGQNISSTGGISSPEGDFSGLGTLRLSDDSVSGDELQATLDHGEHGGAHGHYDKLNMTAYGKGIVWGKDTGSPNYGSNLKSEWFPKTVAHNTVGIRDRVQNATSGATKLLQTSGNMHVAVAEAQGSFDSAAKYVRANVLVKPYVVDIFRVANASAVDYPAVEDAHIQDGSNADTNFGSKTSLTIKGINSSGTKRMAYVKMDFAKFADSTTSSATLNLYGRNSTDSTSVPIKVYRITDDSWNASTMTWNTGSPNHSSTDTIVTDVGTTATYLGTMNVTNTLQYYQLDVTSFVNDHMSDKKVSFILVDEDYTNKVVNFNSSENASNKPKLLITGNSNIDYDYVFHNPNSTLDVSGVTLNSQSGALGSTHGYQYIDTLSKGTTDGQWSAEFTDNMDTAKKYKITMLPIANMEVTKGQTYGMGTSPDIKQPILVAKKTVSSTGNTDFISVHEPYATTSQISNITTEDNAVKITRTSGDIDYIRHDLDLNRFGFVSKNSTGELTRIENIGYSALTISGINYISSTSTPASMSVEFNGTTLDITQTPSDLGTVNIYVGTQSITSVVVNGVSKPFTINGDIVTYGPITTTYNPAADSYIRDGSYADTNFGSAAQVYIKNTPTTSYKRMTYLKFDLNTFGGSSVETAILRLYGRNAETTANVPVKIYGITDDTWSESVITWNTGSPNHSSTATTVTGVGDTATYLTTVEMGNINQYFEFDVTSFINNQMSDKIVSFIAVDESGANANVIINSRENSSNKPELVITN
jgi:hypothetical protein